MEETSIYGWIDGWMDGPLAIKKIVGGSYDLQWWEKGTDNRSSFHSRKRRTFLDLSVCSVNIQNRTKM